MVLTVGSGGYFESGAFSLKLADIFGFDLVDILEPGFRTKSYKATQAASPFCAVRRPPPFYSITPSSYGVNHSLQGPPQRIKPNPHHAPQSLPLSNGSHWPL